MVTSQRGFTLVEVMIVVALMGILLAIAIPSVNDYMATATLQKTSSQLVQAYRQAQAVALRNPTGNSTTAAGLKLSQGMLLICAGDPTASTCSATGTTFVMQSTISASVALNGTSNSWSLAFSSTGIPAAGTSYSISNGGRSVSGTLQ